MRGVDDLSPVTCVMCGAVMCGAVLCLQPHNVREDGLGCTDLRDAHQQLYALALEVCV